MSVLATMAVGGDLRHLERMQGVAKAGRRPAAILFADLEGSSPLGGRALASKALLERLEPEDGAALGLDPSRLVYIPLANLTTATEKARRDAPAIAVCEV